MAKRENARFEELVLPHMGAGYNLARWMLGDADRAEDALQDAAVKAFRSLSTVRGGEIKPWFLAIVRNTCLNALRAAKGRRAFEMEFADADPDRAAVALGTSDVVMESMTSDDIQRAIEALPAPLREVVILRELEDLSYREIAAAIGIPEGTVMSRLARARERLASALSCGGTA
jgi:RNA polymerase sigma factor (sigma-70 family)